MSALPPFSAVLDWVGRATWEASVLALLVLAIQAVFGKRLAARWRFALWWLVLLRLLVPTTIPTAWSAFNLFSAKHNPTRATPDGGSAGPAAELIPVLSGYGGVPEPASLAQLRQPATSSPGWHWGYRAIGFIWVGGVFGLGVRLCLASCWLKRQLRKGVPIQDSEVLDVLKDCARLMGVRRTPVLLVAPQFDGPAVVGCLRPRLLLPERLMSAFSPAELRHIFLHELAHIRRRDTALNWLATGLETLHWFNPLLRYSFWRMRADRELACDALALSRVQPGENYRYGQTILKLLEGLTRPAAMPGAVGILEEKQQMKRRLEMITRNELEPKRPLLAAALLAALGMFTLTDAQTPGPNVTPAGPPPTEAPAVAAGTSAPSLELAAREREIDRQHLQRIYQAIRAYYKDHKDLPNWLSDLVPQYLPDAGDLISPVETRTGKAVLFGREDPKIHTSYIYEFNGGPAAEEFNRGRAVPLTCKEWKLMQLRKFGLVTPILRCHVQQPVLNVAYSGEIYETGLLWEDDPNTAALITKNPALGPQAVESPGPRVTVLVVDASTGEPVASAALRSAIGSEFGLLPPAQTATDANGNAGVALGDWKVNFLYLTASHPLYYTCGSEWNRDKTPGDAPPTQVTLRLTRKPGKGSP